jgi:hypothetical protein
MTALRDYPPNFGSGCDGKLLFVFYGVCIPTDIQGPYNFLLLRTHAADVRRGTSSTATWKAASFKPRLTSTPAFGHHPKWGETPEELSASINFETPEDQDAYGNKLDPVENLTPVFKNNYDKLYAAVDKMTGVFKECKDMLECNETVHWNFKLTGVKMEPMVFEGKKSLIDFTNKIKESKATSVPVVSCQP